MEANEVAIWTFPTSSVYFPTPFSKQVAMDHTFAIHGVMVLKVRRPLKMLLELEHNHSKVPLKLFIL